MKKIIFIVLSILSINVFAQDIDIKKDMVFIDGKEAFKINGGAMSTNFSIENLDGKKLIFFKLDNNNTNANGTTPAIVTFAGYPQLRAQYQPSIPFKKMIAKEIVQNDLIIDGQLSEENIYRYCNATMPLRNQNVNVTINTNNHQRHFIPLDRNLNAPIFTNNNTISQDFKTIGKYRSTTNLNNGKSQRNISIVGYDNTKIADINYYSFSEEAELYLYRNDRSSIISIPKANDIKILEDIIKYLIDLGEI